MANFPRPSCMLYCFMVDSCNCDSNWSGAVIGALVGAVCVVIIIMAITKIMVWIYFFRKRHHTGTYV